MKNILITGGAGFIGSHVVKFFVKNYPNYNIINIDNLTYAGNLNNLKEIEDQPNYRFIKKDICDFSETKKIFINEKIDSVIHLAAESHVDRSISDPFSFAKTNVLGTLSLLQASKISWKDDFKNKLFYHVSTDEVYGTLGEEGLFTEKTPYDPHSPYSASKASSDHFVRAFYDTYKLPIVISNCSNNYGPCQYPEKLIPLFINNIINNNPISIYGDGKNIRDWLYVNDHISAIDLIFHNSKIGKTYNIGGNNEISNNEIANILIKKIDQKLGRKLDESKQLIKYIDDRLGHDKRYAIDSSKIKNELGWEPKYTFDKGIDKTIDWYIDKLR
jgi:dTDP-glucose 4,6-dehydratase